MYYNYCSKTSNYSVSLVFWYLKYYYIINAMHQFITSYYFECVEQGLVGTSEHMLSDSRSEGAERFGPGRQGGLEACDPEHGEQS